MYVLASLVWCVRGAVTRVRGMLLGSYVHGICVCVWTGAPALRSVPFRALIRQ